MSAALADIVANKTVEVERRKALMPVGALKAKVIPADGKFKSALACAGIKLICEIKPKSPSGGVLRRDLQLASLVESFNKHAAGISVLTDETYFGGSLDLLRMVKSMTALPILCKDFVLDPYQCFEARYAGADAVLLIAKILGEDQMRDLYREITSLGMVPLVEIQNQTELERATTLKAEVVLINNRNLDTFNIDLTTTLILAPKLPAGTVKIAASGIQSRADIDCLRGVCSNFLIGSALMRSSDVESKLVELKSETTLANGGSRKPPTVEDEQL